MNFFKQSTVVFFLTFSVLYGFSQSNTDNEKQILNSSTLSKQFDYVIKKSGDFVGSNGTTYEAVKKSWLFILKRHALDSLKTVKKNLKNTMIIVDNQTKEIEELKSILSNTKNDLETTNKEKDILKIFGAQMSKSGYKMLMWIIISSLLALLIFFIFRFKNSNAVTKRAKKNLSEIEEEFENHRRIALEREQKVRRQLQDEINKQKGI